MVMYQLPMMQVTIMYGKHTNKIIFKNYKKNLPWIAHMQSRTRRTAENRELRGEGKLRGQGVRTQS